MSNSTSLRPSRSARSSTRSKHCTRRWGGERGGGARREKNNLRDHVTQERRAFVRFFACEQDLSHESPDAPLPDAVANGVEPFLIIGAIAGG
jgi:hypothetical protein